MRGGTAGPRWPVGGDRTAQSAAHVTAAADEAQSAKQCRVKQDCQRLVASVTFVGRTIQSAQGAVATGWIAFCGGPSVERPRYLMIRAGLPTTTAYSGTSFVTTLPPPMTAP